MGKMKDFRVWVWANWVRLTERNPEARKKVHSQIRRNVFELAKELDGETVRALAVYHYKRERWWRTALRVMQGLLEWVAGSATVSLAVGFAIVQTMPPETKKEAIIWINRWIGDYAVYALLGIVGVWAFWYSVGLWMSAHIDDHQATVEGLAAAWHVRTVLEEDRPSDWITEVLEKAVKR